MQRQVIGAVQDRRCVKQSFLQTEIQSKIWRSSNVASSTYSYNAFVQSSSFIFHYTISSLIKNYLPPPSELFNTFDISLTHQINQYVFFDLLLPCHYLPGRYINECIHCQKDQPYQPSLIVNDFAPPSYA